MKVKEVFNHKIEKGSMEEGLVRVGFFCGLGTGVLVAIIIAVFFYLN